MKVFKYKMHGERWMVGWRESPGNYIAVDPLLLRYGRGDSVKTASEAARKADAPKVKPVDEPEPEPEPALVPKKADKPKSKKDKKKGGRK